MLVEKIKLNKAAIPKKYLSVNISKIQDKSILKQISIFCTNLDRSLEEGDSLFISGSVGSGKSSAGIIPLIVSLFFDKECYFISSYRFADFDFLNSEFDSTRTIKDFLYNSELLVLDGLGNEYQKYEAAKQEIKNLVRFRLENKKSTIITTTFDVDNLIEMYTKDFMSILKGNYKHLNFGYAIDLRKEKE